MVISDVFLRIGCCLLVLGLSSTALSQDVPPAEHDLQAAPNAFDEGTESPEFEVEIVVFAYNAFNPAEEQVDRNADEAPSATDPWSTDGTLDAPEVEPFRFSLLSEADLKLTAARDRLERLDAYTVLIHTGWIQQGPSEDRAHPFDMSLFGIPSIAGTLQLHLARFVHVTAALDYYPPAATVPQWPSMDPYARDAYAELPPKYVLEQTRRMRTGELHYFDHPAFGLLVTVRPHEAPWGETGHE